MGWLDARPGIDSDMNFGKYYYAYTGGSIMDRTGGGKMMKHPSRTVVLAAFAFLFLGIVAVVLLLPALY
jgi:hypothetical protein